MDSNCGIGTLRLGSEGRGGLTGRLEGTMTESGKGEMEGVDLEEMLSPADTSIRCDAKPCT